MLFFSLPISLVSYYIVLIFSQTVSLSLLVMHQRMMGLKGQVLVCLSWFSINQHFYPAIIPPHIEGVKERYLSFTSSLMGELIATHTVHCVEMFCEIGFFTFSDDFKDVIHIPLSEFGLTVEGGSGNGPLLQPLHENVGHDGRHW